MIENPLGYILVVSVIGLVVIAIRIAYSCLIVHDEKDIRDNKWDDEF